MSELVNGVFSGETRERMLVIVDKLQREQRIEGLVLVYGDLIGLKDSSLPPAGDTFADLHVSVP